MFVSRYQNALHSECVCMVGRGIHYQSLRGIMQIHQLISACLDKHTKKAFTCLVIPPLNTWDGSMSNILIWH